MSSSNKLPGSGPDFICIGQARAGTRWLFDQMNARGDIWMPPVNELNVLIGKSFVPADGDVDTTLPPISDSQTDRHRREFLSKFADCEDHVLDFDWYRQLFDMKGDRKSGDISPSYANMSPAEIALAVKYLPDCKFIYLLREPVSRLWSDLSVDVRAGRLTANRILNWARLKKILGIRRYFFNRRRSRHVSFASQCWKNWSKAVPAERIRFWFFDDIVARPADVRDEICKFVGLATGPGAIAADYNRKQTAENIAMPPEIRAGLAAFLAEEYKTCARIFGGHAIDWRDQAADVSR